MMQPLIRWFRVVLPRGGIVGLAALMVVMTDLCYIWCEIQNWIPDERLFTNMRLGSLTFCSLLYGLLRVTMFHPALHVDYRRWLELTPWRYGKPLPVGPLQLVPQDLVVVLIFCGLHHTWSMNVLWLPVAFLVAYVVTLSLVNLLLEEWQLSYAAAFCVATLPLYWQQPEYILGIMIVGYCFAGAALDRTLRRFPWSLREEFDGQSFKTQMEVIKERRLGWPFEYFKSQQPKRWIPVHDGICLSLLAGWLYFTVMSVLDSKPAMGLRVYLLIGIGINALLVFAVFQENHRSPISFAGRLATYRWIIPSFDQSWIVPLIASAVAVPAIGLLPIAWASLALTGYLLVMLVLGPQIEVWRLTAQHRMVFGSNKALSKDFVEL